MHVMGGGGGYLIFASRYSVPNSTIPFLFTFLRTLLHFFLHFLAPVKITTLFFSWACALFDKNTGGGVPRNTHNDTRDGAAIAVPTGPEAGKHFLELPSRSMGISSRRAATMFVYEVPRLRNRNDCHDAGGPHGRTGRHRYMRDLPGFLVRSLREPEALSRLHTEAHEIHRRTLDTRKAVASGNASLPAVRHDAAPGARLAAKHAVHLLAMRQR